jgi:hypothetical protein
MRIAIWRGETRSGDSGDELGPVDTATLDGLTRYRVELLVWEVGFFELPGVLPEEGTSQTPPTWHRMRVSVDRRWHEVRWTEHAAIPVELTQIQDALEKAGVGWHKPGP